ncbi:MAG: SGNH/GDSL hydrolase family protein [Geminicoccales bacterium]
MINSAKRYVHPVYRLATWSLLLAFLLVSPLRSDARAASDVDDIFFFGDSISDTGNACLLPFVLEQLLPGSVDLPGDLLDECRDARYYLGRATHAPTWAEVFANGLVNTPLFGSPLHELAAVPIPIPFFPEAMLISSAPPALIAFLPDELGLPPTLLSSGANLAVSGAETEDLLGPGQNLDPIDSEIGAFFALASTGAIQPSPEDLYVVWIGANDIRRQIEDVGDVQIDVGVERIISSIQALQDNVGAQRFLVPNLPDVGLSLDLSDQQSDLATLATKQWNETLASALDFVAGADVTTLDAFCLTNALIRFGKLDTKNNCLDSDTFPTCQGLLLFDEIHATESIHKSFGIGAQAAIECGNSETGSKQVGKCVAEFTRAQVKDRHLTRQEGRAINRCVGKTQG